MTNIVEGVKSGTRIYDRYGQYFATILKDINVGDEITTQHFGDYAGRPPQSGDLLPESVFSTNDGVNVRFHPLATLKAPNEEEDKRTY